jgi:hypothetical protein
MIKKVACLMVCTLCFISTGRAEHFLLKWQFDDGIMSYVTILQASDSDHDGFHELFFISEQLGHPVIYEMGDDGPELVRIIDTYGTFSFHGVGDYDRDGLVAVLLEKLRHPDIGCTLRVYESVSIDSMPGEVVWLGHMYGSQYATTLTTHFRAWGDMDGNGTFDFVCMIYGHFYVWENAGDNNYEFVVDTIYQGANFHSPALGDFDGDGHVEIIAIGNGFWAIESTGEHTYELVLYDTLENLTGVHISNVHDNLSANDMDQDGKPEFILHGHYGPTWYAYWRDDICIFEASGDNQYELVWYDSLWPNHTWWDYGAMSDVGDIDADSVEELVLSTTGDFYVIQAMGDNDYSVTSHVDIAALIGVLKSQMVHLNIEIHDMDNNGLNEIIASATYEDLEGFLYAKTFILEKGIDMEWIFPSELDTFPPDTQVTLQWKITDNPSLIESVYVYYKQIYVGSPRTLIFRGDAVGNSFYNWTVPDTEGVFRLDLVCTGPGRRDSVTSTCFRIGYGIEEGETFPFGLRTGLLAPKPNPAVGLVRIQYELALEDTFKNLDLSVLDVSGRVVRRFDDLSRTPGRCTVDWRHSGSGGIYFIHFQADDRNWVRKVVLTR